MAWNESHGRRCCCKVLTTAPAPLRRVPPAFYPQPPGAPRRPQTTRPGHSSVESRPGRRWSRGVRPPAPWGRCTRLVRPWGAVGASCRPNVRLGVGWGVGHKNPLRAVGLKTEAVSPSRAPIAQMYQVGLGGGGVGG